MTPSKWAVPSVTRGEVDRAGRLLARNGGSAKLRRHPSMKLSRMQDIGGVRAVLSGLTEVEDLWRRYRAREKRSKHAFVTEKNYIREPKAWMEQEKRVAADGGDVVLVAADSLASLRRAYPNYFGDTRTFVEELKRLLS